MTTDKNYPPYLDSPKPAQKEELKMENNISREAAFDVIHNLLAQLEEGNDTIVMPSYTLHNTADPIGIKNVNFSSDCAFNKSDDRYEKWCQQRLTQGFDNTELWSLDNTILRFIQPRLKAFINGAAEHGYPGNIESEDEWKRILGEMEFAIDWYLEHDMSEFEEDKNGQYKRDEKGELIPTADAKRAAEGWKLFGENFFGLWD